MANNIVRPVEMVKMSLNHTRERSDSTIGYIFKKFFLNELFLYNFPFKIIRQMDEKSSYFQV